MGLIAEAARSGIATVITAAPVGELGVAYARTDYPQPGYDDHAGALVYPLFHVLRGLARAQGKPRIEATSEAPRCVRAVAYGLARPFAAPTWSHGTTANRTNRPSPGIESQI
jgi:hypothetical protein